MSIKNRIVAAFAMIALLAASSAFARGFVRDASLFDRIKPGATAQEVEQILGAPANRSSFPRLGLTSMDYVTSIWGDTYDVGVMLGPDGRVREVQKLQRHRGIP
jgi:outer membrane protein assembly factor BamE (lipoprotein component of BamABCDE complex)